MKSKTYVFSYSVQCLGGISPEPVQAWKVKIKWYLETRSKNWIEKTENRWNSSRKISQESLN